MNIKVNMELAVKPIYKEEELLQNFPTYTELVDKAQNESLPSVWRKRHDFVCPGIENDECIALLFRITCTDNVDELEAGMVISDFFNLQFKKENVLSIRTWKDNIFHCIVLIYPLKGRMIKGSLWLS